jgi:hypothetical protein
VPSRNGGKSRQGFARPCSGLQSVVHRIFSVCGHEAGIVHHICAQEAPKKRCADKGLSGTWCHCLLSCPPGFAVHHHPDLRRLLPQYAGKPNTRDIATAYSNRWIQGPCRLFCARSRARGTRAAKRAKPLDRAQNRQGKSPWPKWHFMPLGLKEKIHRIRRFSWIFRGLAPSLFVVTKGL